MSSPVLIDAPASSQMTPPTAAPLPAPERLGPSGQGPSRKGAKDLVIERFEQKFVIHPRLVAPIREFIRPFCIPDPNGRGDIPEYIVTTLQLDTPSMDLALMKEKKFFARFKLRVRTYGLDAPPKAPIFLEVKRKIGSVIVKSRAKMNRATYHEKCVTHPETAPLLKTAKDNAVFLEFCRISNEISARPKMLIRYIRESYFGANDDYARVTFDRRISYRPTRDWILPGEEVADWRFWRPMDTPVGFRRPYAGYIFELKSMRDTPTWMLETIERFNLTNTGFCKYATAWRLETLYRGFEYAADGANTTY
ncbi:MAG: VTC domain-containing protein [Verrucomicrobiales bacterium]